MLNYRKSQENNKKGAITPIHFHFLDEYVNPVLTLHRNSVEAAIFVVRNFVHNVTAAHDPRVLTRNVLWTRTRCTHFVCAEWNRKRNKLAAAAEALVAYNAIVDCVRTFLKACDRFGCSQMLFLLLCVTCLRHFVLGVLQWSSELTRLWPNMTELTRVWCH